LPTMKQGRSLSKRGLIFVTTKIPHVHESNNEAKKESKQERLNLCHNKDPHICWKIFGHAS
jgi:hypothetical protein